ncbi:flagellar protein FlaG [Peptococcaceae bacterium 1198_IL3148]
MVVSQLDPAVRTQQIQQREQKTVTVGKRTATGEEQPAQDFTELETAATLEQLTKAVEQANKTMENFQTNLHFELHEESGEYLVKVVNSENKEIVREIPPEWVLDMVAYFREIVGIMVDEIV